MRLGRCSAAGTSMNCKDSSKSNPVVPEVLPKQINVWLSTIAKHVGVNMNLE